MPIQVGDKIPAATLKDTNMQDVTTKDLFANRKVVVFAVPGAFTPTCSEQHVPGFVEKADEILAKGIDEIVCVSVNDAFVMGAWGKDRGVGNKVRMLADGNADFAKALGLEFDGSGIGFGVRCQRFAMVVDNGTATMVAVEKPMKFEVSSADAVLAALEAAEG